MTSPEPVGIDASGRYLLGLLAVLGARVRRAVDELRRSDPLADDAFRGLYIRDAEIDVLLDGPGPTWTTSLRGLDPGAVAELQRVEGRAEALEASGVEIRFRRLARSFELDALDRDLLLVALAPDVEPRFERLYAYLQDDVSRRRASTGLALRLCGVPPGSSERRRFGPGGALVESGLVTVEEEDRPFLSRPVRVPDRVVGHVLGGDDPDPALAELGFDPQPLHLPVAGAVAAALRAGCRLVYLRQGLGGAAAQVAVAGLEAVGCRSIGLDLALVDDPGSIRRLAVALRREAGLREAALVMGPVEALSTSPGAIRALADLPGVTIVFGSAGWDASWSTRPPLVVDVPPLSPEDRAGLWKAALRGDGSPASLVDDPVATVNTLRLSPTDISLAAAVANERAAAAGRPVAHDDLLAGGRSRNAGGLERLARRIQPRAGWDDLVLPAHVRAQLGELEARVRWRERVRDEWGMGRGASTGRGVTALFAGPSGTGKTLSAEVLAHSLGLDLYVVELATVIDKYIGETEKNLDRIFAEADRVNGLLLFDEADALFGKRSEVRDAHDRYANVEVAYLLQRMERFDGLAVLTTNLRANVDEAFTRRLDAMVDFPVPDASDRLRLWQSHLAPPLPLHADADLDFLARGFRVPGGSIANIALCAAFLAAADGRPVQMADLIRGTEREYRKLGNLCLPSEFGPYHHLVAVAVPASG